MRDREIEIQSEKERHTKIERQITRERQRETEIDEIERQGQREIYRGREIYR